MKVRANLLRVNGYYLSILFTIMCIFTFACKPSKKESPTNTQEPLGTISQTETKFTDISECMLGTWGTSKTENASFQLDSTYLNYPDAEKPYLYKIDGTIFLCHDEKGDTVFIRNLVSCSADSLIMQDYHTKDTIKLIRITN